MELRDLATKAIELAEKATKGPWYYPADGREIVKTCKGGYPVTMSISITHAQALANNAFIAFARDALPKLAQVYLDRCVNIDKIAEANDRLIDDLTDAEAKIAIAREALDAARSVLSEEGVKEHLSAYVMGVEFINRMEKIK